MTETDFDLKSKGTLGHLKAELQSIRTGRATPSLVDRITVEAYGTRTPINQLANISCPDAKTITIEPWDKNISKNLEKAVNESNLGISPTNEGNLIRLTIPPLTEEDRRKFAKLVDQQIEEARIAIRSLREDNLKSIKNKEKSKDISEDQSFQQQKKLQEIVDHINQEIQEIGDKKKEEIMTI